MPARSITLPVTTIGYYRKASVLRRKGSSACSPPPYTNGPTRCQAGPEWRGTRIDTHVQRRAVVAGNAMQARQLADNRQGQDPTISHVRLLRTTAHVKPLAKWAIR